MKGSKVMAKVKAMGKVHKTKVRSAASKTFGGKY